MPLYHAIADEPNLRQALLYTFIALAALAASILIVTWIMLHIKKEKGPQTVENWNGENAAGNLGPTETAVLFRAHPGEIFYIALLKAMLAGKVSVYNLHPITVSIKGEPSDYIERALFDAIGEDGQPVKEKIYDLFEKLYDRTNAKMKGLGGPKTVEYYKAKIGNSWRYFLKTEAINLKNPPWLILRPIENVFNIIPKNETGDFAILLYHAKRFFKEQLFTKQELGEKARDAKSGFFVYRKDLYDEWKHPAVYKITYSDEKYLRIKWKEDKIAALISNVRLFRSYAQLKSENHREESKRTTEKDNE